ncbi:hypothetical protein C8Q78DRAFT_1041737, partial [Trametes maxima]
MRDYFDDFTSSKTGYHCGPRKDKVITSGALALSAYDEETNECLHFLWSSKPAGGESSSRMHPLDDVVATLLSWFAAYYRLTQPVQRVPGERTEDEGEPPALDSAFAWIIEKEAQTKKQGIIDSNDGSSLPPTQVPKEDTRRTSQEDLQLASNLDTHQPTIQLLIKTLLHTRWPESDRRSTDLRPKNWKAKDDQVGKNAKAAKAAKDSKEGKSMGTGTKTPSRSRVSTKSKRSSQTAGNAEAGPSTKRRKI